MAKARTTGEKVREAVHEIAKRGGVDNIRGAPSGTPFTVPLSCEHPSGFLFMRRVSADWDPRVEEFYCPLCNARRHVNVDGTVVVAAKGRGWE